MNNRTGSQGIEYLAAALKKNKVQISRYGLSEFSLLYLDFDRFVGIQQ